MSTTTTALPYYPSTSPPTPAAANSNPSTSPNTHLDSPPPSTTPIPPPPPPPPSSPRLRPAFPPISPPSPTPTAPSPRSTSPASGSALSLASLPTTSLAPSSTLACLCGKASPPSPSPTCSSSFPSPSPPSPAPATAFPFQYLLAQHLVPVVTSSHHFSAHSSPVAGSPSNPGSAAAPSSSFFSPFLILLFPSNLSPSSSSALPKSPLYGPAWAQFANSKSTLLQFSSSSPHPSSSGPFPPPAASAQCSPSPPDFPHQSSGPSSSPLSTPTSASGPQWPSTSPTSPAMPKPNVTKSSAKSASPSSWASSPSSASPSPPRPNSSLAGSSPTLIHLLAEIGGGPIIKLIAIIGISLATITTNIAANMVAPANALVSFNPSLFNFRRGAVVTAAIGLLFQPWKLLGSSESFVYTWLLGSSALIGPIGGIMIVDYYLVKGMELDVEELYKEDRDRMYFYCGGYNLMAMAALVVGILPAVPGFLNKVGILSNTSGFFVGVYNNAWFVSFFLAGFVYWGLSWLLGGKRKISQ